MAELSLFGFQPGNSALHRFDPRFKLISLMLISISLLHTSFYSLGLIFLVILWALIHIRLSFFRIFSEIRFALLLLIFVFLARSLSVPGPAVISWGWLTASHNGLVEGLLISGRLLTVILCGLCLMATTKTSEIRTAVQYLLKPLPFIPEKRIAVMLSLLIRFIPMILNQAIETAQAQRSRGIELRKNPVSRLVRFSIALMRRIFLDADRLVTAMRARSYSENRTPPEFSAEISDWVILSGVLVFCVTAWML